MFGILACRFRVFLGRSDHTPEIAVDTILELLTLQNLLRRKSREFLFYSLLHVDLQYLQYYKLSNSNIN